MDTQEESRIKTQGSGDQTNFTLQHSPKTDDSVMNLNEDISRPVVHQLDSLIEEDEDVDYPPPRLITGLPEPINVEDPVDTRRSNSPLSPEITSPRAPCLLFTTEEIKVYIDHLETKLNILYENMQDTNRYLEEVLQEQNDDKNSLKNLQRLLNQQEVELIFYRKMYRTGKNYANEPISKKNKKLKTPPKTEFFKYSFGKKLNIEMHPVDVDPDIKDAVDRRVRDVLQTQVDKEILSPNPDFQNILYIDHPTEESKDEDVYPTRSPGPEPVGFQDTDSHLHQYYPLGSTGSSTTSSSPSPIQNRSIVNRDSETFEDFGEPEIYEVPLQFRDEETLNYSNTDVTSGYLTESTELPFNNVKETKGIKEAESVLSSTSLRTQIEFDEDINTCITKLSQDADELSESSLSLKKEFEEDTNGIKLSEEVFELPEYSYKEKGEYDTASITNLMSSIKDLSIEITRETAQQDVKDQQDNESLTEKEKRIIEEIEKYIGIDDNISDLTVGSSVLGKVPYVSTSDIDNFQLQQKLDLVSDMSRDTVTTKGVRTLTTVSETRGSKKKMKKAPIELEKRRYPLKPVYRSNTQRTILPPIRPNNNTHKTQSKFTVQEKLIDLPRPDMIGLIGKSCTSKKSEPVLYEEYNFRIQSDESHFGLKSKPINPADDLDLSLPQLPTVHTKPIIKENKHRTDNRFSLPQITSASTKPNLRNQLKTTILPDKLKPEHTTSQYTASTSSATRHCTKSANYKLPKILLPVPPKIYQSNRRKEKQPHKLPPICQLGLNDVFPSRTD